MLECKHLTKVYAENTVNEKVALNDVSFTLNDGDFVTIIGSNGAGKSTLFQLLSGTEYVDGGKIVLDKDDITFQKQHQRAKRIGHLFQNTQKTTAPNMTVVENLALSYLRGNQKDHMFSFIHKKDRAFFYEQLKKLDMKLEERMDEKVGHLSGGQRQALALLMATIVPCDLLLLDEHTAALDPNAAKKVLSLTEEIVSSNQMTCMMITHNLQDALTYGNRMIVLHEGRIIMDFSEEEKKNLTVESLLEKFQRLQTKGFQEDRMLFSI